LALPHPFPTRRSSDLADLVYTSLDGDETSHVAARGEGSYDGILAAITRLVADGKPLIAICVVTEHSLGHVDALLRLAESIGFRRSEEHTSELQSPDHL